MMMPWGPKQRYFFALAMSYCALVWFSGDADAVTGARGPNEMFRLANEGSNNFLQFNELPAPEGQQSRTYTFDMCRTSGPTRQAEAFCTTTAAERAAHVRHDPVTTSVYDTICNPRTEGVSRGYQKTPAPGRQPFSWGYYEYTCQTVERFESNSFLRLAHQQITTASTAESMLSTSRTAALLLGTHVAGLILGANLEGIYGVSEGVSAVAPTVVPVRGFFTTVAEATAARFPAVGRQAARGMQLLRRGLEAAKVAVRTRQVPPVQGTRTARAVQAAEAAREAWRGFPAAEARRAAQLAAEQEAQLLIQERAALDQARASLRVARGAHRTAQNPISQSALAEGEAEIARLEAVAARNRAARLPQGSAERTELEEFAADYDRVAADLTGHVESLRGAVTEYVSAQARAQVEITAARVAELERTAATFRERAVLLRAQAAAETNPSARALIEARASAAETNIELLNARARLLQGVPDAEEAVAVEQAAASVPDLPAAEQVCTTAPVRGRLRTLGTRVAGGALRLVQPNTYRVLVRNAVNAVRSVDFSGVAEAARPIVRQILTTTALAGGTQYLMYQVNRAEDRAGHPDRPIQENLSHLYRLLDLSASDPTIYHMRAHVLETVAQSFAETRWTTPDATPLVMKSAVPLNEFVERFRVALRAPRPPVVSAYLYLGSRIPMVTAMAFWYPAHLVATPVLAFAERRTRQMMVRRGGMPIPAPGGGFAASDRMPAPDATLDDDNLPAVGHSNDQPNCGNPQGGCEDAGVATATDAVVP